VVAALERAARAGELTPSQLRWSLERLAGRAVREGDAEAGERQVEIVGAAKRVFGRDGYHHATIDAVAAELGLTKAGVYHYFASKQAILEAICEGAIAASEVVLDNALSGPGGPAERVRAAVAGYADLVLADDGLQIFIRHFDELSDLKRTQIRRRRKAISARLREVLVEGVATGELEVPDPAVAVHSFFGSVNWIYSWYEGGGRLTPGEVRDRLVEQVVNGVVARRSQND
jgi:AcrR family transcriptional regulator